MVIATHLDQEWGGEMLKDNGAGIFLTMVMVLKNPSLFMQAVRRMLENLDFYRKNMEKLHDDLSHYNPIDQAADCIENFMNGQVTIERNQQ